MAKTKPASRADAVKFMQSLEMRDMRKVTQVNDDGSLLEMVGLIRRIKYGVMGTGATLAADTALAKAVQSYLNETE